MAEADGNRTRRGTFAPPLVLKTREPTRRSFASTPHDTPSNTGRTGTPLPRPGRPPCRPGPGWASRLRSMRGQGAGRSSRRRQPLDGLPDEHVRRGAAPAAGNGEGIPYPRTSPAPGRLTEKTPTRVSPNPFLRTHRSGPIPPSCLWSGPYPPASHWSSPIPPQAPIPAPGPRQEREKPRPRAPASRARPPPPPPRIRTRSVSTRQGRVRKMIPVSVCGACRPEVLAASPLIQHRCDIVNTLVGGSGGFFCHSMILSASCRFPPGGSGVRGRAGSERISGVVRRLPLRQDR